MREPRLDYFYGDEARVGSFCRLPRIFVTDEFYCTIPAEIKVLYSLMLDRVGRVPKQAKKEGMTAPNVVYW